MSDIEWMFGAVAGVFVGGMLGGFVRWMIMNAFARRPLVATLVANVAASAVIGFTIFLPSFWQTAAGVGFAGALSTLSLLARQLGELVKAGKFFHAVEYATVTASFSVLAAALGSFLAR